MRSPALVAMLLLGALVLPLPAQTAGKELVGCLTQNPNGGLQFHVRPSGSRYLVQGNTAQLSQKLNNLLRVRGEVNATSAGTSGPQVIAIQSAEVIAGTCASALPAKIAQAVVGKVGEGQVAIPVTTTASAGQNTPGYQTETIAGQAQPAKGQAPSESGIPKSLLIPGNVAQAAQSAEAAEIYAQSAARSEIQPATTLGTNELLTSSGTEESEAAGKTVVIEIRGDQRQEFSPSQISVKVGETVQWRNASRNVHEIVANPAKNIQPSQSSLPANTRPFDSGFLSPGATFSYSFSAPGTYKYFCALNCSGNLTGQVIVHR